MASGKHIGYSMFVTLNNVDTYFAGYCNQWVHSALLGDPSLRLDIISPPSGITIDTIGNVINIQWSPSKDSILGYWVYRRELTTDSFERITPQIITDTFFLDQCLRSESKEYMVRAVALTTNASGSYYNLSLGISDTIITCDPYQILLSTNHFIDFSITTNQKNIDLTWVINYEQEGTYYTIEKSANGLDFIPISQINGQPSNQTHPSYSFTDVSPYNGINFYRIRSSNEQSQLYSIIRSAFIRPKEIHQLFPNPCSDILHVHLNHDNPSSLIIEIFDQLGQQMDIQADIDRSSLITIPVSSLTSGMYEIRIRHKKRGLIMMRSFSKN